MVEKSNFEKKVGNLVSLATDIYLHISGLQGEIEKRKVILYELIVNTQMLHELGRLTEWTSKLNSELTEIKTAIEEEMKCSNQRHLA